MKTLSAISYHKRQQAKRQQRMLKISLFLFVWLFIIALTVFHGSVAVGESRTPQSVVIEEGDSLWSVAASYLPEGENIRTYISKIRKHNQMTGATVYPGQVIQLP